jgi:hypothetical protein
MHEYSAERAHFLLQLVVVLVGWPVFGHVENAAIYVVKAIANFFCGTCRSLREGSKTGEKHHSGQPQSNSQLHRNPPHISRMYITWTVRRTKG